MSSANKNKMIFSIGCSCINRFQLNLSGFRNTQPSGFFDWNITTPQATLDLFDSFISGKISEHLSVRENFLINRRGRLINKNIPGLYFWHEDATAIMDEVIYKAFDEFQEKTHYKLGNFLNAQGEVHLLWSNLQPNLRGVIERATDEKWEDFMLTESKYAAIKKKAEKLFPSSRVHFISRSEDCAPEISANADVTILKLPRGPDFSGDAGLYEPLFAKILN
jgi:hypothetical protein